MIKCIINILGLSIVLYNPLWCKNTKSKIAEEGNTTRKVHIEYSINVMTESMSNISGGIKKGTAYNGLVQSGMDISIGSSLFRGSFLLLSGDNPSDLIGDGLGASNMHGYNSLRLYEIWYERRLLHDKLNVRIGSLLADAEFSVNDLGGLFINSAFGWPAYISGNTVNTGPAFFVTAPGVRIRYTIDDQSNLQAGIYDGDPFDNLEGDGKITAHGNHWKISKGQGIFSIGEYGRKFKKSDGGNVKLGFWNYSNWNTEGYYPKNITGLYFSSEVFMSSLLQYKIFGVFFRAGVSISNHEDFYSSTVDGGFLFNNLFPFLKNDVLGFGLAFGKIAGGRHYYLPENDQYIPMDYEMAIESSLRFQIYPWLEAQPDIQFIFHPGGGSIVEDATVTSIRFIISD